MKPNPIKVVERYLIGASVLTGTYYHATYLGDAEKIARYGFQLSRAKGRGKSSAPLSM